MNKPRGPLTLLMTSRSFRRWTAVTTLLPVLYVASVGPICWWFAKEPSFWMGCTPIPKVAPRAYWPIGWLAENAGRRVHDSIYWYATPRKGRVLLPIESSGQKHSGLAGVVDPLFARP